MKYIISLILAMSFSAMSASMSDIDYMTRDALVNHFETEYSLQISYDDVSNLDFTTVHDPNLCDFEVSTRVDYLNHSGRKDYDYCNVCFVWLDNDQTELDTQFAYCIE